MSYPYQYLDDDIRAVIPSSLAAGGGDEWLLILLRDLERIDLDLGEIYRGLADPREAMGPVLDLVGDVLREPRGGLGNAEYRRILACRSVARNGVSRARVWAGWQALTGCTTATGRVVESSSIAGLLLEAQISWAPSREWLRRAGRLVATKLVGAGVEVNATVYTSTSALYDSPAVGYDIGRYAYSLATDVA